MEISTIQSFSLLVINNRVLWKVLPSWENLFQTFPIRDKVKRNQKVNYSFRSPGKVLTSLQDLALGTELPLHNRVTIACDTST